MSHCRICGANDRTALVDEIVAKLWASYGGDIGKLEPGGYWHQVFLGHAEMLIDMARYPDNPPG